MAIKFIPYIEQLVNNNKNIQLFVEMYSNIFEKNREKSSTLNPVYNNVLTGKKYILNHNNEGFFSEDCKGGLFLFVKDNITSLSDNTLLDEQSRILEVIYRFNGVSNEEAINMYRNGIISVLGNRQSLELNTVVISHKLLDGEDMNTKILDFNKFEIKNLDTSFLVKKRGISKSILENSLFENVKTIAENFQGKQIHTTAFLFRNEKGIVAVQKYYYSIKEGKYKKFFLEGSNKKSSLWLAGDKNNFKKIFFFENPIDAISFYELQKKKDSSILLVATGGVYTEEQLQYIKQIVLLNNFNKVEVFLGNDNDEKGKYFNEKLITLFNGMIKVKQVNEIVPNGKDFNEDLQQKKRMLYEQM